jgi:integrase
MPKLTPQQVSALTLPPDKRDALFFDEVVPGLALRLRAGGSKTWTFQYRIGTRQRRLNIGAASALSPHEARKRAALLHAKVKLGQDPADEKTRARAQANETFGIKLPLFLSRQKERLRPRAYVEVERHLTVHAKRLHHLPLAGVARRDVAQVLTTVTEKLSGASANRVRSSLSSFFSWSIREGLIDSNPAAWTDRREEAARTHLLTDDELRDIWMALSDDTYSSVLRLLILTGARREEIGGLKWSEIDLAGGLITLPPERTKTGSKKHRGHEIVLSPPALAILKSRPGLTWPDGRACDLVFGRGARGFSGWVENKAALDERIRAARATDMRPWTLHDFRRVISTTMHERLRILPHVVEAILGHVGHQAGTPGKYNLATYRDEKRRALETWAKHLAKAGLGL